MMKAFSAILGKRDGVMIRFSDGEHKLFTAKTEDMDEFANEYIDELQKQYPDHLRAIDLLHKELWGDKKYSNMRKFPYIYKRHVVRLSLACCFSVDDNIPAYDEKGEFHIKFSSCPYRGECSYDGFFNKNPECKLVICNPIYHLPLTDEEITIVDKLINTIDKEESIASELGLIDPIFRCKISNIYNKMNVVDRFELKFTISNKRIK